MDFYHNVLVEKMKVLSKLLDNEEQCMRYERLSRAENVGISILGRTGYDIYVQQHINMRGGNI